MIRGGRGGYWEDQGYEWYAGMSCVPLLLKWGDRSDSLYSGASASRPVTARWTYCVTFAQRLRQAVNHALVRRPSFPP